MTMNNVDYENMTEPEKLQYLFDQARAKKEAEEQEAAADQKAADPFKKVLDKYGAQEGEKGKPDPFKKVLAKYEIS